MTSCIKQFCLIVFQVDDLLLIEEKIDLEVRSLETCMFDHKTFSDILNRVQKAVDDLNLHSYSNLPIWVNKLDIEVCTESYILFCNEYKVIEILGMFWCIVEPLSCFIGCLLLCY